MDILGFGDSGFMTGGIRGFRDIFRDCQNVMREIQGFRTGSGNARGWSIGKIRGFWEAFRDCQITMGRSIRGFHDIFRDCRMTRREIHGFRERAQGTPGDGVSEKYGVFERRSGIVRSPGEGVSENGGT